MIFGWPLWIFTKSQIAEGWASIPSGGLERCPLWMKSFPGDFIKQTMVIFHWAQMVNLLNKITWKNPNQFYWNL